MRRDRASPTATTTGRRVSEPAQHRPPICCRPATPISVETERTDAGSVRALREARSLPTAMRRDDRRRRPSPADDGGRPRSTSTMRCSRRRTTTRPERRRSEPRPGQWYVVHTQSGYEKKVTANLNARIQSMNMEDKIYEIVIPMEEVDEFKNGKKQTVQTQGLPGLPARALPDGRRVVVLRAQHTGHHRLRRPERQGQKPTPLSRREVKTFLSPKTEGRSRPHRAARPSSTTKRARASA